MLLDSLTLPDMAFLNPNVPITVIAHRGASGQAPENTLASLYKAHDIGVNYVEFDVTLSADKQPVIFHDATLERTTNGQGVINEKTWADLKPLDAGSWFSPDYAGEPIPNLSQYLEALAETGLYFNLEIKPSQGDGLMTAQVVCDELKKFVDAERGKVQHKILVSSFGHGKNGLI